VTQTTRPEPATYLPDTAPTLLPMGDLRVLDGHRDPRQHPGPGPGKVQSNVWLPTENTAGAKPP
jgi:hypothetical protein